MNNVVGKTLIVLQLIFSLCFMCFAGASYAFHAGWKTKAETAQSKLKNAEDEVRRQQDQRNDEATTAKKNFEDMKQRAESAEARIAQLQTDLKQASANLANAEQQREKHLADLIIAQQEADSRIAETTDSRSELRRLRDQINEGVAIRRSLEDEILEKQGQLEEAAEREQQNIARITDLRGKLRYNKIDPDAPVGGVVPPPVEKVTGVVTRAQKNDSRTQELVSVSVGSDDSIEKNMRLIVYRGSKYVCEIEVTEVYPDIAVGRVIENTRQGNIERGDNVTTKL